MQPIKFRAWDKENESMFYWDVFSGFNDSEYYHILNKSEPMQFTGLLDKNGKEIYEGDILKFGNSIQKIVFNRGCFYMEDSDQPETAPDILDIKYHDLAEVIGNQYENPDLISVTN